MLIKFFARGRGSGSGPVDYVCHTEGREHAPPEVLRGDAVLTKNLIDSIDREWRYTSGVISFSLEDAPTPEQQEQVMDEFEKAAFAGLEPDQYDVLWVRHQHTEGGRVELHFVTPRMELTTGKALNIAPPNWDKYFQPLQNALNYENQWADPNSLEHARNTQKATENALRARDRESIGKYIETLVEASLVANRAEIIKALEEAGLEITRRGKDYISVKDPENPEQKAFRLKGAIYAENWTAEQLSRAASIEAGSREATSRGDNGERAANARRELENNIRKRAEFNSERYERPVEQIDADLKNRLETDDLGSVRKSVFDTDGLDNFLGGEQFQDEPDRRFEPANRVETKEPGQSEREDGWTTDRESGWGVFAGFSKRRERESNISEILSMRRRENLLQDQGKQIDHGENHTFRARIAKVGRDIGEWYETGRRKLAKWLHDREEQLRRSAANSRNAANEYRENINQHNRAIIAAISELSVTNRAIGQATDKIRSIVKTREKIRQYDRDDDFEPEL